MKLFLYDLAYAFRNLAKSPGFTLLAVLTLALGIGANTAIFGVVDRMLFRSLPFPEAGRLVVLERINPARPFRFSTFSYPDFLDYQGGCTQLASMAALCNETVNLSGDGKLERLNTGRVSWSFLDVLGVQPILGRALRPEDDRPGSPRVAILGYALWERRFGGDPGIVGRTILLNGQSTEVIGVLPAGFECPYLVKNADMYVSLALSAQLAASRGRVFLNCIGRMKQGTTLARVVQEASAIAAEQEKRYPQLSLGYHINISPLHEEVVRNARPALLTLLGTVVFILLIACVNVANLLLVRGAGREREMAIRAALGADRRRLVTQLLTESFALSLLGSLAGLLLAKMLVNALRYLIPFQIPPDAGHLDLRMLGFTLSCALLAALLSGLFPAYQSARQESASGLGQGSKGTRGPSQRRLHRFLVGAEVALATVLLVGAGLMVKNLWRLQHMDPGFDPKGVLMAQVFLPAKKYDELSDEQAMEARLLGRLSAMPGVKATALTDSLPLSGSTSSSSYQVEGEASPRIRPMVFDHKVSIGYFKTMGILLVRGRDFAVSDNRVVIVDERFARRHWPNADPIGKRISINGDNGPWLSILGVVRDVHHVSLESDSDLTIYRPLHTTDRYGGRRMDLSVMIKTTGDPAAWKTALKAAVRDVDPEIPVARMLTMEELMLRDLAKSRSLSLLFSVFSGLAIFLAAMGIYGVTSFMVTQRKREIGIRRALGASLSAVMGMVFAQGFSTVALGAAVGLAGALAFGRLMQSLLSGVSPYDPLTYVAMLLILLGVALLACIVPALRAARIQPAEAIRDE